MRNAASHYLFLPFSIAAVISLVAAEEIPFNGSTPEQAAEAAPDTSETTTSSPRKPGNFGRLKDWKPSDPKPSAAIEQSEGDNTARPQRGGSGSGSGGMAGFEHRLKAVGAKTGDVQISLAWNTIDDVDLYVDFTPGNGMMDSISYRNRIGRISGGMLDVDMNAGGRRSNTPVENVFWPPGSSPQGMFTVGAHLYASRTRMRTVPIVIRIKRGDDVETIKSSVSMGQGVRVIRKFEHPASMRRQENSAATEPEKTKPTPPSGPQREKQETRKQNPFQPN